MSYIPSGLIAEADPDKFRAALAVLEEKWPPEFMSEGRPDFLRLCLVLHDLIAQGRLALELGKGLDPDLDLAPLWERQAAISVKDIGYSGLPRKPWRGLV